VIEYQRNVCGHPEANSAEFSPFVQGEDAAVVFMPEGDVNRMGGTMRLGSRRTKLLQGSLAHRLYDEHNEIDERHRHRYEVNPVIIEGLEAAGLLFSGAYASCLEGACYMFQHKCET
jgi:CTP synthase